MISNLEVFPWAKQSPEEFRTFQRLMSFPREGLEFMVHNFFNPQPVKGAAIYYLGRILHDWPDEKAVEILKDLIPAMDADSRVLINDMALPYTGVHWWVACVDLQMYTMHGALERNVHTLVERQA